MQLPDKIQKLTAGMDFEIDGIGMSDSKVLIYPDRVLKIQPAGDTGERDMMCWLSGKLPIPKILEYEEQEGLSYLLMSRIKGEMACSARYMQNPAELTRLLAQGLKQLWQVDVSHCPVDRRLGRKLEEARCNVEQAKVDLDNVQPDTFGDRGFSGPEALLDWLITNQPEEERVLSHGDYCLPNVFLDKGRVSGFIDLGRCGVADKWCDIALCYRSLRDNFSGVYDGKSYPGFDPMLLFEQLELAPNWEKIQYYILLDELF